MINFKMQDKREFRFCEKCKVYKLPRMHHCSQCNACCIKYDHHCGMVMNCIGVNNYHLFIQFMILVVTFMSFSFYLNLKYNFYLDCKNENAYKFKVLPVSFCALVLQVGSALYAAFMLKWYYGMAGRNIHALEESLSGQVYNKIDFWKKNI